MSTPIRLIAFAGNRRIGFGSPTEVALATRSALLAEPEAQILVFEVESGRQTELDLRGTDAEIQDRLRLQFGDTHAEAPATRPGKGRPRLGVVAREVTLLPRHWSWLATRPGGASVMLRKLVEQAMRNPDVEERRRQRQEAAYRFMHAMAGNEAGFEEASRALFAGDGNLLRTLVAGWPADVREHLLFMLEPEPPEGLG